MDRYPALALRQSAAAIEDFGYPNPALVTDVRGHRFGPPGFP
ncbi:hypothetical protein Pth03_04730 [Planotetraspora thailandica]|uniref:Uncharacterized protein n=1 Tax=Planotetraspora thailandica TaxID=487172 RepID=A0A8J3XTD7_9ACTN|nr:hypothetical protein [Planotetraspora thailandica]GII52084.1 hypothetical protein Pth03_04730 [Planotetraspora thailandica]